jgi:hypothetical protein
MNAPTYSIRDAAWMIVDYLAPEPTSRSVRRAEYDKVRKRIIYTSARADAPFALLAGTVERDAFLRWAARTYPGYQPPRSQMRPVALGGRADVNVTSSSDALVLPDLPDDLTRQAWIEAEQRAASLQRQLSQTEARIAELEGEVFTLRETDRKRREKARRNGGLRHNL